MTACCARDPNKAHLLMCQAPQPNWIMQGMLILVCWEESSLLPSHYTAQASLQASLPGNQRDMQRHDTLSPPGRLSRDLPRSTWACRQVYTCMHVITPHEADGQSWLALLETPIQSSRAFQSCSRCTGRRHPKARPTHRHGGKDPYGCGPRRNGTAQFRLQCSAKCP